MSYLIIFVAAISTISNPNGTTTQAPPQPQFILYSSDAACQTAKAQISTQFPQPSGNAGNYRVFALCTPQ